MAYKAGACVVGEKKVLARLGDIKILIIASDAGENVLNKVIKKSKFYQIPLINYWSKKELDKALPKKTVLIGISSMVFFELLKR